MNEARREPGFTLVELLVVIAILAISLGMVAFLSTGDKRDAAVSSSAQELAATLRAARAMAMDKRCICAVAFNIQNAPGTSGLVLNNHGGGHWYRMIGPSENTKAGASLPIYPSPDFYYDFDTVPAFLASVKASWVGDRHVLPPHRVRFLALSDQDNGGMVDYGNSTLAHFQATFPRPWFGNWDEAAKRLRPWGGYDPALVNGQETPARQTTGFYYAGMDGTISGSRNPADRITEEGGVKIFAQGAGRPLVNAEWLDYVIEFRPDGSVVEGPRFRARIQSALQHGAHGGVAPYGDLGDMSGWPANPAWFSFGDPTRRDYVGPMVSYQSVTGWWSITLGPDAERDSDAYGDAREALTSLMPAYRVMVNRLGEVRVMRISNSSPKGVALDATITNWQDSTRTRQYYQRNIATNADGTRRSVPAVGFLTYEMLRDNRWWTTEAP